MTSFYYEVKPTNGGFIFKLFSKGEQLKVKLANLKFSKIRDGPWFLLFWGGLVIGGRDYCPVRPTVIEQTDLGLS